MGYAKGPECSTSELFDWRKHLPIYPNADLYPLMSEAELRELAEEIRQNGLRNPIVLLETESRDENGNLTPIATNEALITASNTFHREIGDFVLRFEPRFQAWLESSLLTDEARASLHNMLMQGANSLMSLAQEVGGRAIEDEEAAA
jgi:hypothetical protein